MLAARQPYHPIRLDRYGRCASAHTATTSVLTLRWWPLPRIVEAASFIAATMKINTSVPHSLFARLETALLKLPADVGMPLADQDYTSWETAVQSYIKEVFGAESAAVKALGETGAGGSGSTSSSGKGASNIWSSRLSCTAHNSCTCKST